MRSSFFLFFLTVFTFVTAADQNDLASIGPLQIFTETPTQGTFEERAIDFTQQISDRVSRTGQAIDLLLARHKYTEKRNNSHVNVSQLVTWGEGGTINKSTDFGFNLALPNVEKRWQLRFSSYDEEQESRDLNQRTVRTTPRPRDPGAALIFFKKLGAIKTSFQPRLQLKNPLQVSYVVRLESAAEMKAFRLEPRVELYADSIKGTGEFAEIHVAFAPQGKWQFALDNDEEYRENQNYFSTHHGVSASYALSNSEGLNGAFIASSENHAFHLTSLNLSVGYGKEIYKDLLKYGITPFIGFAQADAFHGRTGISATLEVIF